MSTPNNRNNKADPLNLNSIVQMFFQHQLLIKMLHFQTKSYGAHRATDRYLVAFALLFDNFMEVAQGIYVTVSLKKLQITGRTLTDKSVKNYLREFVAIVKEIWGEAEKLGHADLMNILDEIAAEANKLIYLLGFK